MSRAGSTTRDRSGATRRSVRGRGTGPAGGSGSSLPSRRAFRRPVRRRRQRVVRVALAVVAAGVLLWLLFAGPLLAVRSVQVDGLRTLPAELVREAAEVDRGTPLLRLDVDAAEARVARLPQVASVEVTRGWPDSVVITVAERVPVAIVGPLGERSLIDAEGVVFDLVTGEPPAGVVPLVVADPRPGDPTTMAALAAVGALPAELRGRITVARAESPDTITLQLTDGTVVQWGDQTESDAKADALEALLQQFASGALEPAGTIDVSTPEAVVLR